MIKEQENFGGIFSKNAYFKFYFNSINKYYENWHTIYLHREIRYILGEILQKF